MIIGGAEDKVRDRVILSRFAALAGGEAATIVVISTASSLGLEAGERYRASSASSASSASGRSTRSPGRRPTTSRR